MAKIAISGNPSGTATYTIASPAGSTDRTLTLPDSTGTVALTSQIPAAPTIASTAEAEAGTNNTNFITPLRMREGFNASGSAPVYACRAWVNFNGTTSPGTIRGSGNVSSVTRNGAGDYTINFSTAMPDANYAAFMSSNRNGTGSDPNWSANLHGSSPISSTAVRITMGTVTNFTAVDSPFCCVSVFR